MKMKIILNKLVILLILALIAVSYYYFNETTKQQSKVIYSSNSDSSLYLILNSENACQKHEQIIQELQSQITELKNK